MTEDYIRKDLIALVADKDMESFLRGLLTRTNSLGVQPFGYDVFFHPGKDPGCLKKAHDFLRAFHRTYRHALVIFDREGCGSEDKSREELERLVENRLYQSGWENRGAAIVIDPELENWVWTNSPHVENALGWEGRIPNLRDWLVAERFLRSPAASKPSRPKEAIEKAMRIAKKPRSSSIYLQLAKTVTLTGCTDKAFLKFRQTISTWFTESGQVEL
jgi:hypothetical protein